jgi:DNA-binding PadR family transcriptional regulator
MARRLAEEGVVELHRDSTYPNVVLLRITPAGREELRRLSVEEAMDHLRGVGAEGLVAVQEASLALRRLAEMI